MSQIKELMSLSGKTVLITGAGGHLGRVIAETIAELGANLILVDYVTMNLEEFASDISSSWDVDATYISCDLESEADRKKLYEVVSYKSYKLDCLINNAAFVAASNLQGWLSSFEGQNLDSWRRAIEVNLTSAFHLSQLFASDLKAGGDGVIVNIASIYGEYGPDWRLYDDTDMGNPGAYAVSKGGLIQLTRWLSTTLAPNVRVNAISPGGIYRNQPQKFVDRYISRTPLNRMAIEDDFRGAIAFLVSNMSSYVTGQVLRVDGGWGVW